MRARTISKPTQPNARIRTDLPEIEQYETSDEDEQTETRGIAIVPARAPTRTRPRTILPANRASEVSQETTRTMYVNVTKIQDPFENRPKTENDQRLAAQRLAAQRTAAPPVYPSAAYPSAAYPSAAYPSAAYPSAAYPPTAYPPSAYPSTTPTTYPSATYPSSTYSSTAPPQPSRPIPSIQLNSPATAEVASWISSNDRRMAFLDMLKQLECTSVLRQDQIMSILQHLQMFLDGKTRVPEMQAIHPASILAGAGATGNMDIQQAIAVLAAVESTLTPEQRQALEVLRVYRA